MKLFHVIALLLCAHFISAQCFEDRHNMNYADSWKSCSMAQNPATSEMSHWIMYDFGEEYTLYNMHVWNYNHPTDSDDGIMNFMVHTSVDGSNWTEVGTYSVTQANASSFYGGQTVANLGGVTAQYVVITGLDNYGGECFGLSEVRFGLEDCDNKIATQLILAPSIIGSNADIVLVTVVVLNTGTEALTNVVMETDESIFSGAPYQTSLQLDFQGDPNGNGVLDPGEIWYYSGVKNYDYNQGDVFVVSAGVTADASCGLVNAGAGKLLFTAITDNGVMPHPELEAEYREKLAELDESVIYPSPARRGDKVNIPLPYGANSDLIIQDASGSIIKYQAVGSASEYQLDTRELSAGMYFASVKNGKSVRSYKFVIID